jgi:acyl dehydratase
VCVGANKLSENELMTTNTIYYEDFLDETLIESKSGYTMEHDEIIAFAAQWDPRPFHLSDEAARDTPLGALCASGVHTLAVALKLLNTTAYYQLSVVCGLCIDNFCLHIPVYVDDELKIQIQLMDHRESRSRPDCGIMTIHVKVLNQNEEKVASFDNIILVNKRPAGS